MLTAQQSVLAEFRRGVSVALIDALNLSFFSVANH